MKPKILARRGGAANAPENTVAAFELAFAHGASGAGCDIRRTKDGVFVAFRDRSAGRLTGHDWPIAGTRYGHLKHLSVLGRAPIAHLDDILNFLVLHPGAVCYFKPALENPRDAAALALEIKKAGVQRRAYILASPGGAEFLRAARSAAPDIGAAATAPLPRNILKAATAAGAGAVCAEWLPELPGGGAIFELCARMFDFRSQTAAAAGAGVEASAGTANNYYDVRRLAEAGVSGIWTDDVPMAVKAIYGG